MPHKRGRIWQAIRNSPGIQISIYFIAFASLIEAYLLYFSLLLPDSLKNREGSQRQTPSCSLSSR